MKTKVAYFLARFPVCSETFIINEVSESIRQGIDVKIFSLLLPSRQVPHRSVNDLLQKVEYLPDLNSVGRLRTAFLHMKYLIKRPLNYLKTFAYCLKRRKHAGLWTFRVFVHHVDRISEFSPDILHTHFAYGSSLLTMLISMLLGIPYTFTIHGWHDLFGDPPPYLREVIKKSLKTITVCKFNKEHILDRYKVPDKKIEVIKCGILVEFFRPSSKENIERLIISVGRLHQHKAYHILIQACSILDKRSVPFQCWIIGDGELATELHQLIDELGLRGKVLLLGEKSNEDVQVFLSKAQIFALTSTVEILPIVNVEALAMELPVVAPSIYGVPELIENGINGFLCKPNDPEDIADKLEYLLDHEDIRRSMGREGRKKVVDLHDLHRQVRRLITIWDGSMKTRTANLNKAAVM